MEESPEYRRFKELALEITGQAKAQGLVVADSSN